VFACPDNLQGRLKTRNHILFSDGLSFSIQPLKLQLENFSIKMPPLIFPAHNTLYYMEHSTPTKRTAHDRMGIFAHFIFASR
jgi:putative membrane protein